MLRGFRWQLLALFLAMVVFVVVLVSRPSTNSEPTQESTSQAQVTEVASVEASSTPNSEIEATIETSQLITNEPVSQVRPADGVPTFREGLIGNVQRLNPLLADLNPVDRDVSSLIFEGLTRINEYGEPEPALAQSWVVSFDQLEYVVSLREDVLWQDGLPFTADDVIFTTTLLSSADFPGTTELGNFWRTVEVEQLGQYLVRFRLSQPLGSFLEALRIGILPEHALRGTTASNLASHPFNLAPIGTGPYQLENLVTENGQIGQVNLRVSPIYRDRLQRDGRSGFAVERLSFELYSDLDSVLAGLQAGDIDGYASINRSQRQAMLNLASRSTELVAITSVEPTIGMVIFNWADNSLPIFSDRRARQALQIGLDRSSIIERELSNTAVRADSPIPLNSWAYESDLTWAAYDPAAARDLLSRVAIPDSSADTSAEATAEPLPDDSSSSARLSFNLLTPDDPSLVRVAQEIAAQWQQIDPGNIEVRVEAVSGDVYLARLDSGNFDTALVELSKNGNADPDVYNYWHQGQYPDGQNYGAANDRTISELLERGRQDWVGTNRIVFYRRFQQAFVENAIAIPLYYPLYTYLVRANVDGVQLGYMASSTDRFQTIADWVIR